MADIIRMPEVLAGATEGTIQTWLVQPGMTVALEQTLAEIETEKAVVELSAELNGVIGRLLVDEGAVVAVGEAIAVVLGDGEGEAAIEAALVAAGVATGSPRSLADSEPAADRRAADAEPTAPMTAPDPVTARQAPPPDAGDFAAGTAGWDALTSASPNSGRRLFASPLVRRLAARGGVDLLEVPGTGPHGRVVRRDLERHLEAVPSSPVKAEPVAPQAPTKEGSPAPEGTPKTAERGRTADFEDVPLDRVRRAIARRLTESKSTVPHFYMVADCRVDELLALRAQVNQYASRKISLNDFILKAVAAALVEVPAANAIWNGDSIRRFSSVDISVAVAIEGGLTTPVVRAVERMPLTQVSATVAELAERARAGRLKQHELEGGSFSVSNLGMYGTAQFTAILNPPQSGILAVGAARQMPVVSNDGTLAVGSVMSVTLSADHRVIDGAVAAQWLSAFQRLIENPLTILL